MADTQTAPATGTFVWNELATSDLSTARSILTQLLGWTAEEMDMGANGTYTIFKSGDQQVGGCWELKGERFSGVPTHWMSYVSVKNADMTAKSAEKLGLTVKMPPTDIPDVGRFAVLEHPTTGTFAILEPKRG